MKALRILTLLFLCIPACFAFIDVSGKSLEDKAIQNLFLYGVVDGYEDDTFRPSEPISRAEFVKLAYSVKESFPEDINACRFSDVTPGSWYAPYVCTASKDGIVSGYGDGTFGPAADITRAEALKVALTLMDREVPDSFRTLGFQDVSADSWYAKYVAYGKGARVLDFLYENFRAELPATRGFAAQLLYRLKVTKDQRTPVFTPHAETQWLLDTGLKREGVPVEAFEQDELVKDIFDFLSYHPDYELIDPDAYYRGALKGMVQSLGDEYTVYVEPQDTEAYSTALFGAFSGIGVEFAPHELGIIILQSFKGSPAEKAGLKAGDILTHADGESLSGKSNEEVFSLVAGEEGTEVVLDLITADGELETLTVTRAHIDIPTIYFEMLEGDIGYLDISMFSGETVNDALDALEEAGDMEAIILDLRYNGGGLVSGARGLASLFLEDDLVITSFSDAAGNTQELDSVYLGARYDVPLVVLMNEYSASASEMVAGALQDHARATIIGTPSFGKGSMQEVITLFDGSLLKLTTNYWYTPNGNHVQFDMDGIQPDELVVDEVDTEVDEVLEAAKQLLGLRA